MNKFFDNFFHSVSDLEQTLAIESSEEYGNVFVLGLPRSGTTLVTQLIYNETSSGSVNNLMARFWGAPLVGAYLSKLTVIKSNSEYMESVYGQTERIDEPHEFSRFWQEMMGWTFVDSGELIRSGGVQWEKLYEKIINLNRIFDAPFVWKPLELITDDLPLLANSFEKSIFVFIDREAEEVGRSIMSARNAQSNPDEFWGSIPRNVCFQELIDQDKVSQVADQIHFLRSHYLEAVDHIPKNRLLITRYADLCSNPRGFLSNLVDLSNKLDGKVAITSSVSSLGYSRSKKVDQSPALIEKLQKNGDIGYLFKTQKVGDA